MDENLLKMKQITPISLTTSKVNFMLHITYQRAKGKKDK